MRSGKLSPVSKIFEKKTLILEPIEARLVEEMISDLKIKRPHDLTCSDDLVHVVYKLFTLVVKENKHLKERLIDESQRRRNLESSKP